MNLPAASIGDLVRQWRRRRRLSQLELAVDAEVSQRHLSFVESGRSSPSREMVLRLAEQLSVPLRERNDLLVAAGFAPVYVDRPLNDPELAAAQQVVERILAGHEPHPALAVDRHWRLVHANRAAGALLAMVDRAFLEPPVNVLKVSLHPDALAPRIGNLRQWREHVLNRLSNQAALSGDPVLSALLQELRSLPVPPGARPYETGRKPTLAGIAIPLELVTDNGTLTFLSTTTVFGTAVDIQLSELIIESFFPADPFTAQSMRRIAQSD